MAKKEVGERKMKEDYSLLVAVVFVLLVVAFGFYSLKEKKEVSPIENKVIIDKNTTCDKVWKGAEVLARLYNVTGIVPTEKIVIAECKTACQDYGNYTYFDYKCTSDNKFLCYCNEK